MSWRRRLRGDSVDRDKNAHFSLLLLLLLLAGKWCPRLTTATVLNAALSDSDKRPARTSADLSLPGYMGFE